MLLGYVPSLLPAWPSQALAHLCHCVKCHEALCQEAQCPHCATAVLRLVWAIRDFIWNDNLLRPYKMQKERASWAINMDLSLN